ncbi:MAG TPA: isochorismatase family cysteine hydrolase [Gaiellaceae bacterium]|nr:isochorismatase family cysteine hydrolase [Gaiellaceae bacterium]
MRDALAVVDVINLFDHEDGETLLASFRHRLAAFERALAAARSAGTPVIYVNDSQGRWDSDAPGLVRAALAGRGRDVVGALAPRPGERFVLKPRYSIFDHTPLVILLRELEIERLLLAGGATEMCIVQSAIDARELGFKVTILADACAAVDEEMERVSLEYAERVVGARVERVTDVRLAEA